MVPCNSNS